MTAGVGVGATRIDVGRVTSRRPGALRPTPACGPSAKSRRQKSSSNCACACTSIALCLSFSLSSSSLPPAFFLPADGGIIRRATIKHLSPVLNSTSIAMPLLPVAVYGLEVPCGGMPIAAIPDFPATVSLDSSLVAPFPTNLALLMPHFAQHAAQNRYS